MSQEPAPEGQGAPVTALNWQEPPGNRWAFWHVEHKGQPVPIDRLRQQVRAEQV